jgi:16S rRNA (guanine527-N7)-methyltransferase
MDINNEIEKYNVSRETIHKLTTFVALLTEWNEKMNLVSKNSLEDVWTRHVLDSLQLIEYIPETSKAVLDIGSGSGFPGIVLAIALQEKIPSAHMILVESITKKATYLNDVCLRIGLDNTYVVNSRIEDTKLNQVDVITARAVADLDTLCGYSLNFMKSGTKALFLKGRTYEDELELARQKWFFDVIVHGNQYSEDGVILEISNLRKRK